jgi:hypothetical protein
MILGIMLLGVSVFQTGLLGVFNAHAAELTSKQLWVLVGAPAAVVAIMGASYWLDNLGRSRVCVFAWGTQLAVGVVGTLGTGQVWLNSGRHFTSLPLVLLEVCLAAVLILFGWFADQVMFDNDHGASVTMEEVRKTAN